MESNTNTPYLNTGSNSNCKHRHTLMMVLGCIIPLVLLGILWIAGVSQNMLSFGIILLCPIMHFLMMKNIKPGTQNPKNQINENKKEEPT